MKKKIVILYYSKSGNTKMLAKRIMDIFREFIPEDVSIELYDALQMNFQSIMDASAFIIGTPEYFGYMSGYIKLFFDELYDMRSKLEGRPAFAFVSHGGGGKAAKKMAELCRSLKFNFIEPVINIKEDKVPSKIETQIQKNCLALLKVL